MICLISVNESVYICANVSWLLHDWTLWCNHNFIFDRNSEKTIAQISATISSLFISRPLNVTYDKSAGEHCCNISLSKKNSLCYLMNGMIWIECFACRTMIRKKGDCKVVQQQKKKSMCYELTFTILKKKRKKVNKLNYSSRNSIECINLRDNHFFILLNFKSKKI